MCFENNNTGQREGLFQEPIVELRSRSKRTAAAGGPLLGEEVQAGRVEGLRLG